MTNPQEQQYTEIVKQAQDAMLTAFETWTRTFQQALDELSTAAPDRELIDRRGARLRRQAGECSAECSAAVHQAADGERHCGRQNRPGQCRLYDEALRKGSVLEAGTRTAARAAIDAAQVT